MILKLMKLTVKPMKLTVKLMKLAVKLMKLTVKLVDLILKLMDLTLKTMVLCLQLISGACAISVSVPELSEKSAVAAAGILTQAPNCTINGRFFNRKSSFSGGFLHCLCISNQKFQGKPFNGILTLLRE